MITIDPQAGEHFNGISDSDIKITSHAIYRTRERFKIPHKQIERWIINRLRKAQFIGLIADERGKERRLYGYRGTAFVLDKGENRVITVFKQVLSPKYLRDSIEKAVTAAIQSELSKMERAIERKETQVERVKADLYSEIGERMKQRQRTKSHARRLALTAFINAMHEHFELLDGDLAEIQREQTKLRKGLVAYV